MEDRIPQGFEGFRIAQVSDRHNAEFGEGNEKLIQLLSQTDPDMIVITGDLIDSRHPDIEIALEFARQAIESLQNESDGYTILLSHRPELFNLYVDTGMDLIFAGHAHGGQFRLPFIGGMVVPNQGFFPKFDEGRFTEENTAVIVSRGVGNSIIPVRFNNRPEIVLVTLCNLK